MIPSKRLGAAFVALMVLALLLSFTLYIGLPLLIGLLVFPALGFTGWALAGMVAAGFLAWWCVIGLLRAAFA
ncbi:hypothetical protein PBI_FLOOF_42 [Microbacterium phage Floof]|uniref:Uncharacterized protein n=1 Tax=Microbacterium phage Floof TaxID=2201433 RepID=A0A2Z4Q5P6_9CAUD|nr:hypothetical protein PBI_FLOOF_42 [Microbacterium phage Floof]